MLIPMFHDAFIKLDKDECRKALDEINPVLAGCPFNPATATVLSQDLSFYPGYRFLDIADYEITPPFRKFVIHKPGHVTVLDWTNSPVYALNDNVPLGLTRETVRDYIRFFFTFVRGPHGKFTVAESVDDIDWREEPPPAARKAMGKMLQPVTVSARNVDGSFSLTACMIFKNTLYRANIHVARDGRVTMADEEILAEDMPVLDSALGQ